jgi:EAL domain-containing protein (putative c-di-GMP-specific phosphodiesterase class I)
LATTRLLGPLIEALVRRGAETVVEGVDSPVYLRAAVEAGFDCMQGDFLARPGLAGTDFDLDPRSLDTVFSSDAFVHLPG